MVLLRLLGTCPTCSAQASAAGVETMLAERFAAYLAPDDRGIFAQAVEDEDEVTLRRLMDKYGLVATPHCEGVAAERPWQPRPPGTA